MSIRQRDYILRLIEQAAAALRRVLQLTASGDAAGAVREAEAAIRALLGPDALTLGVVDAATGAQLVGDPARLGAWARLLAAEAEARRVLAQDATANLLERRALTLALEAALRHPPDGGTDAKAVIDALRPRADVASLPDRYQSALATLDRPGGAGD